jgi:hypothetical protein
MTPALADGHIRLNYFVAFQEWAAGDAAYSFRRFTTDLSHEFPIYRNFRSLAPRTFNGPDSCLQDSNDTKCPAISRNPEGSFGLRLLYTKSFVSSGHVVPFYLDLTLGGSDINGTTLLPSYADYRFRGPNLLLMRGSFEHSIYRWPVGVKFLVDEGRVSLTSRSPAGTHLAHSYAAGVPDQAPRPPGRPQSRPLLRALTPFRPGHLGRRRRRLRS